MGRPSFSAKEYDDREKLRKETGKSAFVHDDAIKTGKVAKTVEPHMDPKGVKIRESRDSTEHPVTIPIALLLDTTGSMAEVPKILQRRLKDLMGNFLADKASGKQYLGDGYPALLISACDDYNEMRRYFGSPSGTLQVGQFESGIEIDNDLGRLWMTQRGGGTYDESYQLGVYFMARHTIHDHWEKRGRKGYLFIIGDEHAYPKVLATEVADVIGDILPITENRENEKEVFIPFRDILVEAQQRYHVFFIIPNMTQHYTDRELEAYWVGLLGQQNVLKLEDPEKVCELIVAAVAICEEHVSIDDLTRDNVAAGISKSLIPLSKTVGGGVSKYNAGALPLVAKTGGGIERL